MKTKLTVLLILTSSFSLSAFGGSATWKLNPTSGGWNTASNWTPATIPNGSSDVATFELSNTTSISFSSSVTMDRIVFNSGASPFTFTLPTLTLTFTGAGIVNNSGLTQNFVLMPVPVEGEIAFTGSASAG